MKKKSLLRKVAKELATKMPRLAALIHYTYFELSHLGIFSPHQKGDRKILQDIADKGYVVIPNYMSLDSCNDCIKDIEWMFSHKQEFVARFSDDRIFGAEIFSDNIMRFAADQYLIDLSEHFMCTDTVNGFTLANKVEAREGSKGSGEGWHKDMSFRQFKVILYLNEVTENNGPFQIIERSHLLSQYLADIRKVKLNFGRLIFTEQEIKKITQDNPQKIRTITGQPGTLVIANTACIHRGCPPREGVRYALTNYFMERHQIGDPNLFEAYKTVSPEKIIKVRQNWNLRHEIAKRKISI